VLYTKKTNHGQEWTEMDAKTGRIMTLKHAIQGQKGRRRLYLEISGQTARGAAWIAGLTAKGAAAGRAHHDIL
jgi:hypothetical protein